MCAYVQALAFLRCVIESDYSIRAFGSSVPSHFARIYFFIASQLSVHITLTNFRIPFRCSWLLCLFINSLPWVCVHHVIDLLLYDGSSILVRTCLGLLGLLEQRVRVDANFDDLIVRVHVRVSVRVISLSLSLFRSVCVRERERQYV